jgi:hypothetical protein
MSRKLSLTEPDSQMLQSEWVELLTTLQVNLAAMVETLTQRSLKASSLLLRIPSPIILQSARRRVSQRVPDAV